MTKKIFGWMKLMMTEINWLLFIYQCIPTPSFTQDEIYKYFQLDSVVIEASKDDLDVNRFVQYMIDDKSFYKAFKNLRTASYYFQNDIAIFKNDWQRASYKSKANQIYTTPCRSMHEWDKEITGNILDKSGEYNYFTMKLYDRLFFTHGKYCDTLHTGTEPKNSKMEKYIGELKTLMFDPGSETHIPLMKAKTNIFAADMVKYYDYRLSSTTLNGVECYLFDIQVKKEYLNQKEAKTIVKKIMTWFQKESKQILKREYELQSKTIAYSFDVRMEVDIAMNKNTYYPSEIKYNGTWKIIGKKRENAKFKLTVSQFR